jgi:hypothetical protein
MTNIIIINFIFIIIKIKNKKYTNKKKINSSS